MSLDLTTALGRLLTDTALRTEFLANGVLAAKQLNLSPSATTLLLQLDLSGLERQAHGLINKRFHEVAKILPMTMRQLGTRARKWFQEYAEQAWPGTHRRHFIDADSFCRFVDTKRLGPVCRTEWNRVKFRLSNRRLAIHFVQDFYVGRTRHLGIQTLFRSTDGNTKESVWFFRYPTLSDKRN